MRKSKLKRGEYPPIRITRATASRNAKMLEKHAEMAAGTYSELDLASLDTKQHNSHALILQGRVHAAAGIPFEPVGKSITDKLASLRSDPAVTILTKTTWRDFFEGRLGQDHSTRHYAADEDDYDYSNVKAGTRGSSGSSGEHSHRHKYQTQTQQMDSFLVMIARVEELWEDLRMCREDQSFYRKSLCRAPAKSADQYVALAKYISMLQEHRMATIRTLQAINVREGALKRVYDVLAAIRRKSVYRDRDSKFIDGSRTRERDEQQQQQQHQQQQRGDEVVVTDTDFIHSNRVREVLSRDQEFWKEELVCVLKDLQLASLEVIRRVQLWRRDMWRPRPFLWSDSVDYLLKMSTDCAILESVGIVRCLASIPLQKCDMACILYEEAGEGAEAEFGGGAGDVEGGSSITIDPTRRAHAVFYAASGKGLESTPLRAAFLSNVNPAELRAAAKVVSSHEALMSALVEERKRLVQSGVFIPTLKLYQDNVMQQPQSRPQSRSQPQSEHPEQQDGRLPSARGALGDF